MPNRPQDRKSKKLSRGGAAVEQALGLQAANMAQKEMLDHVVYKLVEILRAQTESAMHETGKPDSKKTKADLQEEVDRANALFGKIQEISQLTKAQIAERTSRPESVFPLPGIQEALDEAVAKITKLLVDA